MNTNDMLRYAFNQLADLLEFGNAINSQCCTKEECEKTMSFINAITGKMNLILRKMEE